MSTATDSEAGAVATTLASLGGNLFLVFGTLVCGTMAILLSPLPPRGNWVYVLARLWSRGLLQSSGVRLRVSWAGPVEAGRRYIYMANHQSLYDIPALIASLPGQARFLAKRSLFRIPVFGWAIRAGGFISIDRHDRSSAQQSFAAAARRLAEGSSAVIFPEGTRSLDGRMQPFERGGFLLALKSGMAIVPVGISGSLRVQRRGSRKVTPGTITVAYGRPIPVDGYSVRSRDELASRVRHSIEALASGSR